MTNERPILFSGAMVRALLDGRKTQTRRLWKMPRGLEWYVSGCMRGEETGDIHDPKSSWWGHVEEMACPYGRPGDRLWVRETHDVRMVGTESWPAGQHRHYAMVRYRADDGGVEHDIDRATFERLDSTDSRGWTPSIHMPRWASRILLEITDVRAERLQEIGEADCRAEGCAGGHGSIPDYPYSATPSEHYRWLWDSLNGAGAWDRNPWVWVVEFRRVLA